MDGKFGSMNSRNIICGAAYTAWAASVVYSGGVTAVALPAIEGIAATADQLLKSIDASWIASEMQAVAIDPGDLDANGHLERLVGLAIQSVVHNLPKHNHEFNGDAKTCEKLGQRLRDYWPSLNALNQPPPASGANEADPSHPQGAWLEQALTVLGAKELHKQVLGHTTAPYGTTVFTVEIWKNIITAAWIGTNEPPLAPPLVDEAAEALHRHLAHYLYEATKLAAARFPEAYAGIQLRILGEQTKYLEELHTHAGELSEWLGERFTEITCGLAEQSQFYQEFWPSHLQLLSRVTVQGRGLRTLSNKLDRLLAEFHPELLQLEEGVAAILANQLEEYAPQCGFDPQHDEPDLATSASGTDIKISDLRYDRRWMPRLLYRDEEMAELCAFAELGEPLVFARMVGEGGVGRSRLAHELVRHLRRTGWRAGFLRHNVHLHDPHGCPQLHQWKPVRDTLIVIDYASEQGPNLASGLCRLLENSSEFKGRLRVVLLDRPEALTPLLNAAEGQQESEVDREKKRVANFTHGFGEAKAVELLVGPIPDEHWEGFFRKVFARVDPTRQEFSLPPDWKSDVARATRSGRTLPLILLALSYLRADAHLQGFQSGLDALLDQALAHEVLVRWTKKLEANRRVSGRSASELLPALQRLVALVTWCRGLAAGDITEHLPFIRDAIGFGDEDDRVLLKTAQELLGAMGNGKGLRPLDPDLFGERFLLRGGFVPSSDGAFDFAVPAAPFSVEALLSPAMTIDPRGTIATLGLIKRLRHSGGRSPPPPVAGWSQSITRRWTHRSRPCRRAIAIQTDLHRSNHLIECSAR